MRVLYNILLVFIMILFLSCQKRHQEIQFINLYITTITRVKCENLRKSSNTNYLKLSNKENEKLVSLFSQLKPVKDDLDIDARVYGTVYDGAEKVDFCSGIGVIEINNKKYFVDDNLREYLLLLTTKKK